MKLLYLTLGVVLLALATVNVVGVVGSKMGWWHAGAQALQSGIIWGGILLGLCIASFVRCWYIWK